MTAMFFTVTSISPVITIVAVLMSMTLMSAPVIAISFISLTRGWVVLAATNRSARAAADGSTDDGTVFTAYALTYRSARRTAQYTAQHRTTINRKCAGTHKK
jgi:hypothetical protein